MTFSSDFGYETFLRDVSTIIGERKSVVLLCDDENLYGLLILDLNKWEPSISIAAGTRMLDACSNRMGFWQLELNEASITKLCNEHIVGAGLIDFTIDKYGEVFANAFRRKISCKERIDDFERKKYNIFTVELSYIVDNVEFEGSLGIPLVQYPLDDRILKAFLRITNNETVFQPPHSPTPTTNSKKRYVSDIYQEATQEPDALTLTPLTETQQTEIHKPNKPAKRKIGGTSLFPGRKR